VGTANYFDDHCVLNAAAGLISNQARRSSVAGRSGDSVAAFVVLVPGLVIVAGNVPNVDGRLPSRRILKTYVMFD
jgi:hypothetical protein